MLSLPRFTRSLMDALDNDDFLVYPLDYLMPRGGSLSTFGNIGQQLAMPTIKDNKYQLSLDMRNFDPSEISVKMDKDSLQITGKREKKEEDGRYVYREYVQHFTVPENVKSEELKCQLDKQGYLKMEAPLKVPQVEENKERTIPIEFVKK
ncbi:hypothetical protein TYRP_007490 [Tyrophagus putrescentiae]|nr:hypothetical protein TYRP_007490 [Tyrophagus putrescentiae]